MNSLRAALLACTLAALTTGCNKPEPSGAGPGSAVGSAAVKATTPTPATKSPPGTKMDHKGRWAARRMKALTDAAKLTPEQAAQIAALFKAEHKAKREARQANAGDEHKAKRKEAKAAAAKATDEAVKKLLKPEQFAAYTQLRVEWKAKRKARREARKKRMASQLKAFADANKLKPTQVEQLAALMKDVGKAHHGASGQQKDPVARTAKHEELRAAMEAKVKKILDATQFAAYQQWHEKMREDRRKRAHERHGKGDHGDGDKPE